MTSRNGFVLLHCPNQTLHRTANLRLSCAIRFLFHCIPFVAVGELGSFGVMSRSLVKFTLFVVTMISFSGCREHHGDSSGSVKQSRNRGLFVAEYSVPDNAGLGDCRQLAVWVYAA